MSSTYVEAWADIKKPGNGRQYALGTITVSDTTQFPTQALFSQFPAVPASGLVGFNLGIGQRQVALLQVTDASQGIVWQRYFHGTTPLGVLTRACNARGISVWPAATEFDTRVAICGETYDRSLPPTFSSLNPVATATNPAGFIAVFNGFGDLLWSHHAYDHAAERACAITDVSIRVEMQGSTPVDIVTYCGVSTYDAVGAGDPISPVLPFAAMAPSSGGATLQSSVSGQWDGIVGRVIGGSVATQVVFHSIVSGPEQDGLFGIAEIDENEFVVVGSTQRTTTGFAASGFEFPGINGSFPGPYCLGAVMTFDAQPTRTGGNLVLQDVNFIGDLGPAATYTHLRDVVVLRDWLQPLHAVAVVGSTDSTTALSPFAFVSNTFHGGTDGLLGIYLHNFGLAPLCARFHGDAGNDGLTGIQGWNEYPDHVVAAGFTDSLGPSGTNIGVESFFVDGRGTPTVTSIRAGGIGGTGNDAPAVMGATNATALSSPFPFLTGPLGNPLALGDPAGGGVAVDERARVDVVGQTTSMDFPTSPTGRAMDAGADAVRAVFDMLASGVGRSDGTGDLGNFVLPRASAAARRRGARSCRSAGRS